MAFAAVLVVYAYGTASGHWGWLLVWIALGVGYLHLHEKCMSFEVRRYERANPCPVFTLEEPTYEPPEERRDPPPKKDGESPRRPSGPVSIERALEILGLTRNSSHAELKRAYRERIRQYHPDMVAHLGTELRELAERKAKEINEAYESLTNFFRARSSE